MPRGGRPLIYARAACIVSLEDQQPPAAGCGLARRAMAANEGVEVVNDEATAMLARHMQAAADAEEESDLVRASRVAAANADLAAANASAAEAARLASIAATIRTDANTGQLTQVPVCCNPNCPGEAAQRLLSKAEQWKQLDADRKAKETAAAAGGAAAAAGGAAAAEPQPEPEPGQRAEADAFREKTAASAAAALVPDGLKAKKKLQRCSKCKAVQYCGRDCQLAHWPAHKKLCTACKWANTLVSLFDQDEDYQSVLVNFKRQFEETDKGRHAVGFICDSVDTLKSMCDKEAMASGGAKVDIKDFTLEDMVQGGAQGEKWAGAADSARQWLTAQAFTERYDTAKDANMFVQVSVEHGGETSSVLMPACVRIRVVEQ
jgi:hypothetical protein